MKKRAEIISGGRSSVSQFVVFIDWFVISTYRCAGDPKDVTYLLHDWGMGNGKSGCKPALGLLLVGFYVTHYVPRAFQLTSSRNGSVVPSDFKEYIVS
jgi:hypothetical protein